MRGLLARTRHIFASPFGRLSRTEGLQGRVTPSSVVLLTAAFLASVVTWWAWPSLKITPVYSEPMIGDSTWYALDKTRDFRVFALFMSMIVVFSIGIQGLIRSFDSAPQGKRTGRSLEVLLGIALFLAAFWLGHNMSHPAEATRPWEAAAPVALVLAAGVGLAKFRRQVDEASFLDLGASTALAVVLGFFDACGLIRLLGQLVPSSYSVLGRWSNAIAVAGTVGAVFLLISAFLCSADLTGFRRRLISSLLVLQAPLPLLWLSLLPPRMLVGDRLETPLFRPFLPIVVGLLIVLSWRDLRLRCRATRSGHDRDLRATFVLSPLCLGAVALFLQVQTHGLFVLGGDYFHVGEQILPWHQWSRFGKVPYVDFIPIHGLMPFVKGALNTLCFRGSAETFSMAEQLLSAVSVLATFWAIWAFGGPYVALFVSLVFGLNPTFFDRCYFWVPMLVVLSHPALMKRPLLWIWVWGISSAFHVAYNFVVGPACALATLPAAVWMGWQARRSDRRQLLVSVVAITFLALVVPLAFPGMPVLCGFARYLRENSASNTILHGTPWEISFNSLPPRPTYPSAVRSFSMEIIRMSWIGVIILSGGLACKESFRPAGERNVRVLWLAVASVGSLLIMSSWTLGRIDVGTLSRTGVTSILAVGALLPCLLFVGRHPHEVMTAVVGVSLAIGLFSSPGTPLSAAALVARAADIHVMPADTRIVKGRDHGLPKVGQVLDINGVISEVEAVSHVIRPLLRTGETFLDLTNHSAYYCYLDLPVPTQYVAHFIAGAREMQARMLEKLERRPTPVVLIGKVEGCQPSLRSYYLYRNYLLRYVVLRQGWLTMMVEPERVPEAGPVGSETQLQLLDEAFRVADLHKIPLAWGQSWKAMAPLFIPVTAVGSERLVSISGAERAKQMGYRPTSQDSRLVYSLGDLGLAGSTADFLLFKFDYVKEPAAPDARMQIRWTVGGHSIDGPTFNLGHGQILVPLGAYPRWMLAPRVESLELVVQTPPGFHRFAVDDVQLLRLAPATDSLPDRVPPAAHTVRSSRSSG